MIVRMMTWYDVPRRKLTFLTNTHAADLIAFAPAPPPPPNVLIQRSVVLRRHDPLAGMAITASAWASHLGLNLGLDDAAGDARVLISPAPQDEAGAEGEGEGGGVDEGEEESSRWRVLRCDVLRTRAGIPYFRSARTRATMERMLVRFCATHRSTYRQARGPPFCPRSPRTVRPRAPIAFHPFRPRPPFVHPPPSAPAPFTLVVVVFGGVSVVVCGARERLDQWRGGGGGLKVWAIAHVKRWISAEGVSCLKVLGVRGAAGGRA